MTGKVHNRTRIVFFLLSLVILTGLMGRNFPQTEVSAATSSDLKKQIQALQSKLDKNKSDQAKLKNQISSAQAETSSLAQQIQNLDSETTLISDQLTTIEEISAEWQNQQDLKKQEIAQLEQDEINERGRFDRMMQMSYEYGSDSYLELIFGAEDFGDFLARLDLISYHLTYNEKVLKELAENQAKLKNSKLDYEESSSKLTELYNTQQTLKSQLDDKIATAQVKKDSLYAKMSQLQDVSELQETEAANILKETQSKSSELKIVSAQEAAAEAARKAALKAATKITGPTPSKASNSNAQFLWPLPDGYRSVSSGFANRINPVTGKRELHNGLDLPAPARTPIYAADGGTVVLAKWNGGFGNCITINHGNGYITLYGHCSSLNVTAGQVVNRGEVIGYVGSTGQSTGNHLHFTVFINGTAVDPSPYL
jgi:Membrane proteins related to metalloendopeptidases